MKNVIALTNDNKIFSDLFYYSTLYGYHFKIAGSIEEVLAYFAQYRTFLFIVDCYDTRQEYLKFVRRLSPAASIIAVSSQADEEIAVQAFKNGADGFLRLPCSSREFYYRLQNFIRLLNLNTGKDKVQSITLGNIKIYPQNNQVMLGDEFIPLTVTEFKLLLLFVSRLNRIVPNEELYRLMYETDALQSTSRVIGVHISKLRRKLKLSDQPELDLKNIHGKGYCLVYTGIGKNGE